MGSRATLSKVGDTARILGTIVTKIVGGFTVKTKDDLVEQIVADEFGDVEHETKSVKMPCEKERPVDPEDEVPVSPRSHKHYRRQVGRLLFFDRHRGDLQFTTRKLARAAQGPGKIHMARLRRACRYLKGTKNVVLVLMPTGKWLKLEGWSDSDWAGDLLTRRSTTGGVIMLNGCVLISFSRLQATESLSSCEAELNGGTSVACELLYMAEILRCMGFRIARPTLYSDSSSALKASLRQGGGGRLKHLEIRQLALQQSDEVLGNQEPGRLLDKGAELGDV